MQSLGQNLQITTLPVIPEININETNLSGFSANAFKSQESPDFGFLNDDLFIQQVKNNEFDEKNTKKVNFVQLEDKNQENLDKESQVKDQDSTKINSYNILDIHYEIKKQMKKSSPKVQANSPKHMDLLPFTEWANEILEGTVPDEELVDLDQDWRIFDEKDKLDLAIDEVDTAANKGRWGDWYKNYRDHIDLLDVKRDPLSDYNKSFKQIVQDNGFIFEEHEVETPDGYLLSVYRIRAPSTPKKNAPVVFLQHGILSSADCWIQHYADQSPGFQFALAGYDVWLGNNRGTIYSRKHSKLNPNKSKEYWNYSFVELGKYDLPTQIDYARKVTGTEKVTYVGHSQGTTQMFYALATNAEEIAKRVNLFIALAPVVRLNHAHDSFLGSVAKNERMLASTMKTLMADELFGAGWQGFSKKFCMVLPYLCDQTSYFYMSGQTAFNDRSRVNISRAKFPAGCSLKQLIHYAQLIKDKEFQLFDYGSPEKNEKIYGKGNTVPPKLDLSQIKGVDIAMIVGKQDDLANPTDTQAIRDEIGDAVKLYLEVDGYDHGAFLLGKSMDYVKDCLLLMRNYNWAQFQKSKYLDENGDIIIDKKI